jgi:hypothetical protein
MDKFNQIPFLRCKPFSLAPRDDKVNIERREKGSAVLPADMLDRKRELPLAARQLDGVFGIMSRDTLN